MTRRRLVTEPFDPQVLRHASFYVRRSLVIGLQAVRLERGEKMPAPVPTNPSDMTVHLLWLNAGLSCDGDSVSLTAATLPSVEDIVMGAIPGLPKVIPHWPLVDYQVGDD